MERDNSPKQEGFGVICLPFLVPWLEERDHPQLWLDYFDASFQQEAGIKMALTM